ncbi:hypothetical protein [Micromonospora sp. WMMD980]|uniref:hypothetical protein n=1 Tax=Micromonospora sp. WMMD980 TaxID=3016088 RepID=UPI00241734DF|nr:hypothetical protein [Micromonospora sp. WMMD980]MDG4803744.1 hypothetical protein [Micromonospora sp. WMMD980]
MAIPSGDIGPTYLLMTTVSNSIGDGFDDEGADHQPPWIVSDELWAKVAPMPPARPPRNLPLSQTQAL